MFYPTSFKYPVAYPPACGELSKSPDMQFYGLRPIQFNEMLLVKTWLVLAGYGNRLVIPMPGLKEETTA